jgi:hypothetical protein
MFRLKIVTLVFCLIVFLPNLLIGQSWIADTIKIGFGSAVQPNSAFVFSHCEDFRSRPRKFVSVYERKKALFFPVDQIVQLYEPLCGQMVQHFLPLAEFHSEYHPRVYEFEIIQKQSGRTRAYTVLSALELWEESPDSGLQLLGTFYHESVFKQRKKEPVDTGYQLAIDRWSTQLAADIVAMQQNIDQLIPGQLGNFRRGKNVVQKNFYLSADWVYGLNFWGIDGEIWFSRPENNKRFRRSSGIVRYQHHSNFKMIAIGRQFHQYHYRLNNNWLLSNKAGFLLGFNNWNDFNTANHKFEEIFNFNLSATQKLIYNRLDNKGLLFGIGIMENFYYIVHHQPRFDVGMVLNVTLKL